MRLEIIRSSRVRLFFLTFLCIFMHASAQDDGARLRVIEADGPVPSTALARMALPGTQDVQLVIELTRASVAESLQSRQIGTYAAMRQGGTAHLDISAPSVASQRRLIAAEQQIAMMRLKAISGVEVQASTDLVMNAVIARVPLAQYSAVKDMPV